MTREDKASQSFTHKHYPYACLAKGSIAKVCSDRTPDTIAIEEISQFTKTASLIFKPLIEISIVEL